MGEWLSPNLLILFPLSSEGQMLFVVTEEEKNDPVH
jgi:hypothetical protein